MIISLTIISTILLFALATSNSNIINRVENVFSFNQSFPKGDYSKEFKNIKSEDIRKGIYYCSWILAKESIWYGYGIGDVQEELNSCYSESFDTNTYQLVEYNSHNQYLHVLLSAGIFGLLLFLLSLIIPLYLSLKQKNYSWFFFTLFIMGCFLTENIIDRHDGVIFFSLFNSIYHNINEKSINS